MKALILAVLCILGSTLASAGTLPHCSIVRSDGRWAIIHHASPEIACAAAEVASTGPQPSLVVKRAIYPAASLIGGKVKCREGEIPIPSEDLVERAIGETSFRKWTGCELLSNDE